MRTISDAERRARLALRHRLAREARADDVAAVLLPALDPAPMGWQARDWYLGAHRERLFDRSGNIGPTVGWDGRIVGGWAQRKEDGRVVLALLEDTGADAAAAIAAEAQRVRDWIGDVRVTPRVRTPLERELVADATPGRCVRLASHSAVRRRGAPQARSHRIAVLCSSAHSGPSRVPDAP